MTSDFGISNPVWQRYTPTPPRLDRRHKCPHCTGTDKLFTTKNDLDRHRKTFHGIFDKGDKIYRCQVLGCGAAGKIWTRSDNFKQHLARIHGPEHEKNFESMAELYDEAIHGSLEPRKGRNMQ